MGDSGTSLLKSLRDDVPSFLATTAISEATYFKAGYPADFCSSFTLSEIAQRIKLDLELRGVFRDYKQVHFVAHSFGGLVAQRLISDLDRPQFGVVSGITMLGTPSDGAALADFGARLPGAGRCSIINDLRSSQNSSVLQDLSRDWQTKISDVDSFRISCGYEKRPERPLGIIVPRQRLDSTCEEIFAFDYRHSEMDAPQAGSIEFNWLYSSIKTSLEDHLYHGGLAAGVVDEAEMYLSVKSEIIGTGEIPFPILDQKSDSVQQVGRSPSPLVVDTTVGGFENNNCQGTAGREFGASALGSIQKVGPTTFSLGGSVEASSASFEELCFVEEAGPFTYKETVGEVVYFVANRVQIPEAGGALVISIDGLPVPSVDLQEGDFPVDLPSEFDVKSVGDGSGTFVGEMRVPKLAEGNYFLSLTFQVDMLAKADASAVKPVRFDGTAQITLE